MCRFQGFSTYEQIEYKSIFSNGKWEVLPLPKGKKEVGCKWVFTFKRNQLGRIARYKARMVEKGLSQLDGVN